MKSKKGFTLVEIVAVIAILAVIAGIFAVNMTGTLNKNKETEKENVIAQVKSSADAYVSSNPEYIEDLYDGHGYVDLTIGQLRNAGLLSNDISDVETGNILGDEEIVRVKLQSGNLMEFIYPVTEEEKVNTGYSLMAQDLSLDYEPNSGNWCDSGDVYTGLYKASSYSSLASYDSVTSKLVFYLNLDGTYTDADSKTFNLKVSECNVNQKIAGSYQVVYSFTDPDLNTEKTVTRKVYVGASGKDVTTISAEINNGRYVVKGVTETTVTITENYKDGSEAGKITGIIRTGENTVRGTNYTIDGFDTSTLGTREATITSTKKNSDGTTPSTVKATYKVTDSINEIVSSDPNCTPAADGTGCYYKGEQDGNYVNYYGKTFRLYYQSGDAIKIILDNSTTNAAYAQIGQCISTSCCNQGRYGYIALGDSSTGFSTTMDNTLNTFYSSLNGNNTLKYLQSQSFIAYYNIQDYSSRTNNSYYNGLNTTSSMITNAIRTHSVTSKLALLSLKEYKEIAGCTSDSNCSMSKNYLTNQTFWLLDFYGARFGVGAYNEGSHPAEAYDYIVSVSNSIGNITYDGAYKGDTNMGTQTSIPVAARHYVKPTIQLSKAKIIGGDGTSTSPFIIG